jgi:hypothetical protein
MQKFARLAEILRQDGLVPHGFVTPVKWLGLFGQVSRFYKWMTAGFMPQPGLVVAG